MFTTRALFHYNNVEFSQRFLPVLQSIVLAGSRGRTPPKNNVCVGGKVLFCAPEDRSRLKHERTSVSIWMHACKMSN